MDMRSGKMYDSVEAARAAGVPVSDVARVECAIDKIEERLKAGKPVVSFRRGSFKSHVRDADGALVRVG